ncbi:hypothetical protein PSC71_14595 [Devosia sp. J2-20]|uniref:hypothetical protein n=1 Tax=Devosia sp. J2-20 TaxID=3026161 RepID=UPI00249A9546|nr:hypothetical protein [Devosia sp. J2-20]WDQ98437.1 hypothetical protein PSC71_14595 [Devosia sp. J2-20]
MHEFVLVPEGRMDFELLGLLSKAVDLHQAWQAPQNCSFGSYVGIVPTHDSAVVATVEALRELHPKIAALVDGDAAGLEYVQKLCDAGQPNSGVIIRWPNEWTIEDAIGWVVDANPEACIADIVMENPPATCADLVQRLKSPDRPAGGLKTDISSYEAVVDAIGSINACRARALDLLEGLVIVQRRQPTARFAQDPNNQAVWIFQP